MQRKRIKQYLTLLSVIGLVAVVSQGGGTFASFNAEVTNNNNSFATGTLFLHNTNGSTTCTSEADTTTPNANNGSSLTDTTNGCSQLFTVSQLPTTGATGTLAAPGITSGTTPSSITVTTLSAPLEIGDVIRVSETAKPNYDLTVTAQASAGASVAVAVTAAATPTANYTTAATITAQTYTTWAPLRLANAGTLAASGIKFDSPYGTGCTNASNPSTIATGNFLAGTYSSSTIALTTATGGAPAGSSITVGGETLTLAATLNPGASSIVVTGTLVSAHSAASVLYAPSWAGTGLCSQLKIAIVETADATYKHDSTTGSLGCAWDNASTAGSGMGCALANSLSVLPTSLTALNLSGSQAENTGTGLNAGKSRYFVIGVQAPLSLGNPYQASKASFALRWHIDQA
jgi:hypothetical protein